VNIEKQTEWIETGDFELCNPMPARITALESNPNKWGKQDYVLYVRNESNGVIKAMSIFKGNLNRLIEKYGNDTDQWMGKLIQITLTDNLQGKNIKEIKPL
jgi:hypothetical protein